MATSASRVSIVIVIVVLTLCFFGYVPSQADGDDPVNGTFMCLTLQTPNDIPNECQRDIQMPTKALTGYDVDFDYMCSADFFKRCNTILSYVFKLIYTDEAMDFINGLLDALTSYGPKHTCKEARAEIEEIMEKGGRDCIVRNTVPLNYCGYISMIKFDQDTPTESVCYTLDYSFECCLEAIKDCDVTRLANLWQKYYRDTIRHSPCSKYSAYGTGSTINRMMATNILVPITFGIGLLVPVILL